MLELGIDLDDPMAEYLYKKKKKELKKSKKENDRSLEKRSVDAEKGGKRRESTRADDREYYRDYDNKYKDESRQVGNAKGNPGRSKREYSRERESKRSRAEKYSRDSYDRD
ncbi:hypothetical protein AX774_g2539 [Zancudomyces culisetae]|uniref:Uncharacterized protein n=1 Tax=Zancudomyces culisetae TaxID=1213189 RepID=A0A1R1PND7_ZANCU|nr:hypothetical protein AX774_g4104 [Zancudomyces culisetae]OMH83947.1 hypothetical protein AX774_g2539 [Zancudomyces culisetae]|eukprot:OMH82412.1 hypothetical protein AX774_g4104 [Zancudomyces culisetae]